MLELNEDTTLAEALARDERVYDRLSKAAPAYRKFARALMREDTAGRLALRDIANMAGLHPADVVLAARGSEAALSTAAEPLADAPPDSPTDGGWPLFDARPLLIDGHEPLAATAIRLCAGTNTMVAVGGHPLTDRSRRSRSDDAASRNDDYLFPHKERWTTIP